MLATRLEWDQHFCCQLTAAVWFLPLTLTGCGPGARQFSLSLRPLACKMGTINSFFSLRWITDETHLRHVALHLSHSKCSTDVSLCTIIIEVSRCWNSEFSLYILYDCPAMGAGKILPGTLYFPCLLSLLISFPLLFPSNTPLFTISL